MGIYPAQQRHHILQISRLTGIARGIVQHGMTLTVGETAAFEIDFGFSDGETADVSTEFIYTSNNEDVVSVNEDGVVTGAAVGETSVTVENKLRQKTACKLKVTEPVQQAPAQTGGNSALSGEASSAPKSSIPAAPAQTPAPAPTPSIPEPAPAPAQPDHNNCAYKPYEYI